LAQKFNDNKKDTPMRPLQNLKILDFTTLVPGPFATMMLADMGADILRVESPTRPDMVRAMPPYADGTSTGHGILNRNKRSIGLDLKKPEAVAIAKQLLAEYDIVIEQFRPGVMDRFGLGYKDLREINPGIIYCSITGYGQTGPNRDRAGHDNNYLSLSGLNGYSGRQNERTPIMGMPVADLAGGSLHGVIGILAAVNQRHITGQGQHVDISMTDAMFAMNSLFGSNYLAAGTEPESGGTNLNGGSFYDYYRTADGRHLSIGSLEPQFFQQLCATLNDSSLLELANPMDPDAQRLLRQKISAIIEQKPLQEWVAIFADKDCCVEPVLTFAEASASEHVVARDLVVDVQTHEGGVQKQIGSAIKFSNSTPDYGSIGVPLGQHNHEVLKELGLDDAAIQAAKDAGAFG
jgi:crotonobetainyl-CoA:carnitine CoA-transferase CaiB-like acyl-CoA transferase